MPPSPIKRSESRGFTLAELLIALYVLGVIATFTIPKVLTAQQNRAWNAAAKEAIATVSKAYSLYRLEHTVTTSMKSADLTPYFNYVRMETAGAIDHVPGAGDIPCDVPNPCFILHNGGALKASSNEYFGGTGSNHYVPFYFDPDGKYSGSTNGPGKTLVIDLHFNGRIKSSVERQAGDVTYYGGSPTGWGSDSKPDWFSW